MGEESSKVGAIGPFLGEMGWELMGFSGTIRFVKSDEKYKDHKFFVMSYPGRYPIYHDFAYQFVALPPWFTNMKLPQASYDVNGITPELYGQLIKYFRRFYKDIDPDAFEIRPPRGHTFSVIENFSQSWTQLKPSFGMRVVRDKLIDQNGFRGKDIVVVMPRYRSDVSQGQGDTTFSDSRNWPPPYWNELIYNLVQEYVVVVSGTKNGTPAIGFEHPNLLNLTEFDPIRLMDLTLAFMEIAIANISSQSGGTHLGLQAVCPSFIFGHEKHRHMVQSNPLKTPVSFLETGLPYLVEPSVVFENVISFIRLIKEQIHDLRMAENYRYLESLQRTEFSIRLCNICNSTMEGPVVADLLQCPVCDVYKKVNMPRRETIFEGYKDSVMSYANDENVEQVEERTKEAELQLDMLSKFIYQPGKLFDVGCSSGLFMSVARKNGWQVDGNDLSKVAANIAKDKFGFDIKIGMLEDLIIGNDYDCFVLWHTLEHTVDPTLTLEYCYRHLKPNGIIQIAVPLKPGDDIVRRFENSHFYEFSEKSLTMLLNKCGFDILYSTTRSPNDDLQVNVIGRKR